MCDGCFLIQHAAKLAVHLLPEGLFIFTRVSSLLSLLLLLQPQTTPMDPESPLRMVSPGVLTTKPNQNPK